MNDNSESLGDRRIARKMAKQEGTCVQGVVKVLLRLLYGYYAYPE